MRLGGDAQHHRLFALGIARHLHRAIGDRFFEFAGIVGQRTQRQRQLADRARDGDLFGHLGRRLQRDGGIGADLGLAVLAHDIVGALVGGEHADVAHDRFGHLQRRTVATAGNRLRQDQVDPVARKDEARHRGLIRHGDGDRAHARAERRGQEAAIPRRNERALGERLACGDRVAHHRALQLGDVRRRLQIISAVDQFLGPGLKLQRGRIQDGADGQRPRRDQYFGASDGRRWRRRAHGSRLRCGGPGDERASEECRNAGHEQRAHQQNDLATIHVSSGLSGRRWLIRR